MSKIIRLNSRDRDYTTTLNKIVDQIYNMAGERSWSWLVLADKASLAISTVYRLGEKITKLPRFKTVFLLSRAVGAHLELVSSTASAKYARS